MFDKLLLHRAFPNEATLNGVRVTCRSAMLSGPHCCDRPRSLARQRRLQGYTMDLAKQNSQGPKKESTKEKRGQLATLHSPIYQPPLTIPTRLPFGCRALVTSYWPLLVDEEAAHQNAGDIFPAFFQRKVLECGYILGRKSAQNVKPFCQRHPFQHVSLATLIQSECSENDLLNEERMPFRHTAFVHAWQHLTRNEQPVSKERHRPESLLAAAVGLRWAAEIARSSCRYDKRL